MLMIDTATETFVIAEACASPLLFQMGAKTGLDRLLAAADPSLRKC